ncbi:uncharacterized protein [Anabrus simplex]|uniref:uncharacterized protein n=1 Tax=Anabrus simplex TaxID=316456 RepID=UPI0035A2B2F6
MALHCHAQLFLFGVLCIGAVIAENVTCTDPQALSDIDLDKVYGDWFVGKAHGPVRFTNDRSHCYITSFIKINGTTLEATAEMDGVTTSRIFTTENAGTWQDTFVDRSIQVIYLSADGTTLALAFCVPSYAEPGLLLLSKVLPISPDKIAEVNQAKEIAGVSVHDHRFKWDSEATCPPP